MGSASGSDMPQQTAFNISRSCSPTLPVALLELVDNRSPIAVCGTILSGSDFAESDGDLVEASAAKLVSVIRGTGTKCEMEREHTSKLPVLKRTAIPKNWNPPVYPEIDSVTKYIRRNASAGNHVQHPALPHDWPICASPWRYSEPPNEQSFTLSALTI